MSNKAIKTITVTAKVINKITLTKSSDSTLDFVIVTTTGFPFRLTVVMRSVLAQFHFLLG